MNNEIPILPILPITTTINELNPNKAYSHITGLSYYKCQFCKGWICGIPQQVQENTSETLCGRCGTIETCIRCDNEISFFGKVS